jgi:hypothetical protein
MSKSTNPQLSERPDRRGQSQRVVVNRGAKIKFCSLVVTDPLRLALTAIAVSFFTNRKPLCL